MYFFRSTQGTGTLLGYRHTPFEFLFVTKTESTCSWQTRSAEPGPLMLRPPTKPRGSLTLKGYLLRHVPFSPRSIISPADILEYVQRGDSNIVVGSSDPSVSKSSQTDTERPTTSTVMEVQILDQGVSKRAQTGIRQGIPNRAPLNVPFFATLIH